VISKRMSIIHGWKKKNKKYNATSRERLVGVDYSVDQKKVRKKDCNKRIARTNAGKNSMREHNHGHPKGQGGGVRTHNWNGFVNRARTAKG